MTLTLIADASSLKDLLRLNFVFVKIIFIGDVLIPENLEVK